MTFKDPTCVHAVCNHPEHMLDNKKVSTRGRGSVEPFAIVCMLTTIIVKVLREKFLVLCCVV